MIYYTVYAEQKFDILNKHKIFITKEQVEDCFKIPEKQYKQGKYFAIEKEGLKVIYTKQSGAIKVCTFYPIN